MYIHHIYVDLDICFIRLERIGIGWYVNAINPVALFSAMFWIAPDRARIGWASNTSLCCVATCIAHAQGQGQGQGGHTHTSVEHPQHGGCNVVLSTSPHSAASDLLHCSTTLMMMPLVTRPPLLPLCARCSWCRGAPPCWSASPLHQTSPIANKVQQSTCNKNILWWYY